MPIALSGDARKASCPEGQEARGRQSAQVREMVSPIRVTAGFALWKLRPVCRGRTGANRESICETDSNRNGSS